MEIKSLAATGFDTIFEAFSKAFADYELQLDKEQLIAMVKRRGFNPGISFAAFDEGRIVSFTLNGTGDFNGIPTAYDTGTGTFKEYRGKGLATEIFNFSIPFLKQTGIRQYLLEVLQHNTGAVSVYRNIGFETSREFNYFGQVKDLICPEEKTCDSSFTIKRIEIGEYHSLRKFWDFYPSWQNSFDAIARVPESFLSLGVFAAEKIVGYCVFEPVSGDVTQIAVDKAFRRKGIASRLLHELVGFTENDAIKVINTDVTCESITGFLRSMNIVLKGQQFEMIKKL